MEVVDVQVLEDQVTAASPPQVSYHPPYPVLANFNVSKTLTPPRSRSLEWLLDIVPPNKKEDNAPAGSGPDPFIPQTVGSFLFLTDHQSLAQDATPVSTLSKALSPSPSSSAIVGELVQRVPTEVRQLMIGGLLDAQPTRKKSLDLLSQLGRATSTLHRSRLYTHMRLDDKFAKHFSTKYIIPLCCGRRTNPKWPLFHNLKHITVADPPALDLFLWTRQWYAIDTSSIKTISLDPPYALPLRINSGQVILDTWPIRPLTERRFVQAFSPTVEHICYRSMAPSIHLGEEQRAWAIDIAKTTEEVYDMAVPHVVQHNSWGELTGFRNAKRATMLMQKLGDEWYLKDRTIYLPERRAGLKKGDKFVTDIWNVGGEGLRVCHFERDSGEQIDTDLELEWKTVDGLIQPIEVDLSDREHIILHHWEQTYTCDCCGECE